MDTDEFFNMGSIIGKKSISKQYTPSFSLNERRNKWVKLLEENKDASRSQLKDIGKGLHTWIVRYDREWYEEVTPKNQSRKKRAESVDWKKRDEECLKLAKEAVKVILAKEGKPARVTPLSIRRAIGAGRWFEKQKLVKTHRYLEEVTEDINNYRIRKIKWAINEMTKQGLSLTPYKIKRYAGFDAESGEVSRLVSHILEKS
ncbi:TnsD family Tn7-like transposition protein [Niallia sp. Marseille-Q9988]